MDAAGDATEAEEIEVLGELRVLRAMQRGSSVTWWESSTTGTLSEPDFLAEYMFDSEDTSVSSTRASTNATSSISRLSRGRGAMAGYVYRGAGSPLGLGRGYRGRSVTRRERSLPGAAMRHRHPTHTPNRRPMAVSTVALAAAAERMGVLLDRFTVGSVSEGEAEEAPR